MKLTSDPTTDHDFWLDGPSPTAPPSAPTATDPHAPQADPDEPASDGSPRPEGATAKKRRPVGLLVASGVGAAVLGFGAVAGITLASTHVTTAASTSGPGGMVGGAPGQGAGGPGAMGGPGNGGTITAIDGTSITLSTTSGATTKVLTSDATTYATVSDATTADLKAGDNVVVLGTTSDGAVTADRIIDSGDAAEADPLGGPPGGAAAGAMPPAAADGNATQGGPDVGAGPQGAPPGMGAGAGGPGGMGAPTRGVIASISGSTITVTTTDGATVTVTISDATAVARRTATTRSALATGQQVRVQGTTATDGTMTATSVTQELTSSGAMGGPAR